VSGQQHGLAVIYPQERPGTHFTGGWVGVLFDVVRYNYVMFIVYLALAVTIKNHIPEYKSGSSVTADLN